MVLCLLGYSTNAALIIWPDSTEPCDGLLQVCINSASIGDVVEIRTNNLINESLFIDAPISVVAASGYQPIFSAENYLNLADATSGSALTVTIKGLTFVKGAISVTSIGRPITFIIEDNTILENITDAHGINVQVFSESDVDVHINFNQVSIDTAESTVPPQSAILVQKHVNGAGLGMLTGEIYNNTLQAKGSDASGILIATGSDADLDINITGNEIAGGTNSSIHTRRSSNVGTSNVDISSNVMFPNESYEDFTGIHINNNSGFTQADIVNNTIVEAFNGVILDETSGALSANVYNNIIVHSKFGLRFESVTTVNNDNNLLYENLTNINYTPGASMINANPMFVGSENYRLSMNSPALETGNSLGLILVADAPFIDADGLLRVKNSTNMGSGSIDIGAYEAGDISFNHINTSAPGYISTLNNAQTNGLASLDSLHVTANWNPNGTTGVYNNDNEGLFYSTGVWRIFNEGIINMLNGASFNVAKFTSTANTFEHLVSSSGANNSTVNHVGLNGSPKKIMQLTQHWTGIYNPHPVGIIYLADHWNVLNFDLNNIPIDANFNIYYQDRSKSAYQHIAKSANTTNNYTLLDNPLINGRPCAQIQVTQSASQGVFNNSPIGVFYETVSNQWAVFNQNTVINMPENAAFHVLINPAQIAQCSQPLLFKDSFE